MTLLALHEGLHAVDARARTKMRGYLIVALALALKASFSASDDDRRPLVVRPGALRLARQAEIKFFQDAGGARKLDEENDGAKPDLPQAPKYADEGRNRNTDQGRTHIGTCGYDCWIDVIDTMSLAATDHWDEAAGDFDWEVCDSTEEDDAVDAAWCRIGKRMLKLQEVGLADFDEKEKTWVTRGSVRTKVQEAFAASIGTISPRPWHDFLWTMPSPADAGVSHAPAWHRVEIWVLGILALSHVACFAGGFVLGRSASRRDATVTSSTSNAHEPAQ